MLTLSIAVNAVFLGLLFYVRYHNRKLTRRLAHMSTRYETLWLSNHYAKHEVLRFTADRQMLRYHLESMRRDIKQILGETSPAGDDLPPLQPEPTPPECRMVKESFKE